MIVTLTTLTTKQHGILNSCQILNVGYEIVIYGKQIFNAVDAVVVKSMEQNTNTQKITSRLSGIDGGPQ